MSGMSDPSFFKFKGHYYAFFGCLGSTSPFLTSIALQFGASPGLIGVIYATLPIFILTAKLFFGFLADHFQQRKLILMVSIVIMFGSFFLMMFIPPKEKSDPIFKGLFCSSKSSSLALCGMTKKERDEYTSTKTSQTTCDFDCEKPISEVPKTSFTSDVSLDEVVHQSKCHLFPLKTFKVINNAMEIPTCNNETYIACNISCSNKFLSQPLKSATKSALNSQIIYLWILMSTAFTFTGVATSLADTIIIGLLPNVGLYGQQRLFGPMGYGMMAIIAGLLVDTFTKAGQPINFKPCFCLSLILGTSDFLITSRFTARKTTKASHLFRHVLRLFTSPEIFLFAVAVFCVGFFTGILWTFLIVYSNTLGGTQVLSGLIYGIQCFAGEIPFMFMSSWFLRKLGHGHAMTLVMAIFAIRFILYSMVKNPWMILPIEVTQGITFGIFFTALATYSSLIAPTSTHASMQGILQGLFDGLGTGSGSFIGGMVFETMGGRMMWLIMGLALGVLSVIHGFALVMIRRQSKESTPETNEDVFISGDNTSRTIENNAGS